MDARFERNCKMTVGYKFGVRELATFIAEITAAGMDVETAEIHWQAHTAQDQRDETTLTFSATPGRGR